MIGAVIVLAVLLVGVGIVVLIRSASTPDSRVSTSAAGDDFATPASDLGATTTLDGVDWRVPSGSVSVADGSARVDPDPTATATPAIAVVDIGRPAGQVRSTIADASTGAGIVFRYVNGDNYWSVLAAPGYGSWNITKRVDGVDSFVANLVYTYSSDPTDVVLVLDGSSIEVTVGKGTRTVADPALAYGSAAGLIASATDTRTRWESFSVLVPA